jgi:hypothetical protein
VPEPYWTMEAIANENGKAYTLKWGRGKIFERNIVTILHSRISDITKAEVIDVEKS